MKPYIAELIAAARSRSAQRKRQRNRPHKKIPRLNHEITLTVPNSIIIAAHATVVNRQPQLKDCYVAKLTANRVLREWLITGWNARNLKNSAATRKTLNVVKDALPPRTIITLLIPVQIQTNNVDNYLYWLVRGYFLDPALASYESRFTEQAIKETYLVQHPQSNLSPTTIPQQQPNAQ